MIEANLSLWMPWYISTSTGIMKKAKMKASSGNTSPKARSRLTNSACASFFFSGVPSAARTGPVSVASLMTSPEYSRSTGWAAPARGTARFSAYCASQAVKRSFNWSWLSAQNSKPLTRALVMFAAAVGMCGAISVLPSLNRPTSAPDDLRAGP